jgi:Protein of unknown function (DUF2878)
MKSSTRMSKPSTRMSVFYFLVGQGGWFACVLSAAHGSPTIGVMVVAVLLVLHLSHVARPRQECRFLGVVLLTGAIWESLLVRLDLLGYPSGLIIGGFAPAWIVALWALFGGQFNTTYTWLKRRPALAALLGAVAGPLSFRAGAALGAVHLNRPLITTLTLAAGWAVMLPLLAVVSRRWDGVSSISMP